MDKRRFGRISLLVTATLAVLVAVQVWSLVNMYHARREEFSRQVMQAMTRAAYDDLLLGNKPSGHKSHISFSSSGNIDSIRVDMIQEITVKNLDGAGKSITFTPQVRHDTPRYQYFRRPGDPLHPSGDPHPVGLCPAAQHGALRFAAYV